MIHAGGCHCGAITVKLRLSRPPEEMPLRSCSCSFCRAHATRTLSDRDGLAEITAAEPSLMEHYRFGSRTADYIICRRCGVYIGAFCETGSGPRAVINVNCLDDRAANDTDCGNRLWLGGNHEVYGPYEEEKANSRSNYSPREARSSLPQRGLIVLIENGNLSCPNLLNIARRRYVKQARRFADVASLLETLNYWSDRSFRLDFQRFHREVCQLGFFLSSIYRASFFPSLTGVHSSFLS